MASICLYERINEPVALKVMSTPYFLGSRITPLSSVRSEERRVGKEGRSLCDWSSDVCSSDLDGVDLLVREDQRAGSAEGHVDAVFLGVEDNSFELSKIGRASCRERG